MADIELVIKIPDKVYKYIQREWEDSEFDSIHDHVLNGIKHGTPLEQITDEIRQIVDKETEHDEKWARGLHYSLCIIDKHIKESEV